MKEGMKEKLVDVAHKFLSNEIDVHSFFCELEELNRNGIWSCLDSRERETISRYLMIYMMDMLAGVFKIMVSGESLSGKSRMSQLLI